MAEIVFQDNHGTVIANVTNAVILGGSLMPLPSSPSPTPRTKPRKPTMPQMTEAVFTYRWLEEEPMRVIRLYQYLLKAKWLADDTKPDDWCALFMGKPCGVKVRWTGSQQDLYYLFKLLVDRQYIRVPEGVGKWMIVQSHIMNPQGRLFMDFNKQKAPKKSALAIDQLAEVMNIVSEM